MPAFAWSDGDVDHHFTCDVVDDSDFFYRAIRSIPESMISEVPVYILRMFSHMETRWLDLYYLEVVSNVWPYIDALEFFRCRRERFLVMRDHARGYASRNPCGETPLRDPEDLINR